MAAKPPRQPRLRLRRPTKLDWLLYGPPAACVLLSLASLLRFSSMENTQCLLRHTRCASDTYFYLCIGFGALAIMLAGVSTAYYLRSQQAAKAMNTAKAAKAVKAAKKPAKKL